MADRITIRKRGGQWQIRRGTETVKEFPTHTDAVNYLVARQKSREAMRQLTKAMLRNIAAKKATPQ